MSITLTLNPDLEQGLKARARARGLSLNDYVEQLVARDIGMAVATATTGEEKARAFAEWARSHRYTPPLSDEAVNRASMYRDDA